LGAHCDDIEIGCGGTLIELSRHRPGANVKWIVFSSNETRQRESEIAANRIFGDNVELSFHAFRDGHFPDLHGAIKDEFESLKKEFDPDVIFTHYRHDSHQDHRVISEVTSSTFRSHLILEYEIPKYDGDLGNPGTFVPLPKEICAEKAEIIVDANQSERGKHWFSEETFMSLMRIRGIQCRSISGYAEAFYCSKLCLSLEHI
jgi:LmbE family N-acetylglucosaminyl deacetylase